MNIAICDDNKQDAEQIRALLQVHFDKNGYTGDLHIFTSGEAFIEAFTYHQFDAVFLDIYMAGINGIHTATKLRKMNHDFSLVFVTISKDYAFESFSLRADSYVLKPIEQNGIENAFAKCRQIFLKNGRFVEVITDRMRRKVPLVKILYMEVYNKEVLVHTTEETLRTNIPLDEWERLLPKSLFLRCHRSFIVNMNHVKVLQGNDFQMDNGHLAPIRQRGSGEVKDAYADFMSNRLFEVVV